MADAPSDAMDYRKTNKRGNARSSGYARHEADWYQEPPIAVDMLLDAETFEGPVWDPACGGGNIPLRFRARGFSTLGTDLVDRGYGDGRNFLDTTPEIWRGSYPSIVTNPPFRVAQKFVEHAMKIATSKVAIPQRLAFLEGQQRGKLFRSAPPSRILVFSPRISMPPGGMAIKATGGSVAYCWIIWNLAQPTARGETRTDWLP